ncbi:MAG: YicC family protein [Alphaproteobacteria bacterium]|nr:MAG: YicC family protein [Alphaproteobacteria bacterium]
MTLSSMTGFAREEGTWKDDHWAWELRSVNSKNLDIRARMPGAFEGLEADLRAMISKVIKRGSLQVGLHFHRGETATEISINRQAVNRLLTAMEDLRGEIEAAPVALEGLLGLKGVIDTKEIEEPGEEKEARLSELKASFARALEKLKDSRDREGAKLEPLLMEQVARIEVLSAEARQIAQTVPATLQAKLHKQLDELLSEASSVSEDRLAQEIAFLVTKSDIREEIDRLDAHCATARELLTSSQPVGRKLDFLTQEFNRESNTLCSKSPDVELTRIGLELKTVVDQFREQVQNIE